MAHSFTSFLNGKKIFLITVLAYISSSLYAQTFTDSWIVPNTTYAKIVVDKNGLYQMTGSELSPYLPEIIGAPTQNIAMMFRGKPIAIEIQAAGSTFQLNDKIIFYGIENNGDLEGELYRPVTDQPHKFASVFNKNSAYFIYLDLSNAKRINNEAITTLNNKYSIVNQSHLSVFSTESTYNDLTAGPYPIIRNSFFEKGKGVSGPIIRGNTPTKFKIPVKGITNTSAKFELFINGRDGNNRNINIKIANKDTTFNFYSFDQKLIKLNLNITLPLTNDSLEFTVSSTADRFSVSYFRLFYEGKIFDNSGQRNFQIPINGSRGFVEIENEISALPFVYNVTDIFQIQKASLKSVTTGKNEFYLNPQNINIENKYEVFPNPSAVTSISRFFSSPILRNDADYLIISNKKLISSANEYKDFRESVVGGSHKVELVYYDDLVNHFNYGVKSPLALKNYLRKKLVLPEPKTLLLLGKGQNVLMDSTDLVPTYGNPASDLLLSSGIISNENTFGISTGRIPAQTNQEVIDYLQKVKLSLNYPNQPQQKHVFHFTGGVDVNEINNFNNFMNSMGNIAVNSRYAVKFNSKKKTQATVSVIPANITNEVNDGKALLGYFGHSSVLATDFNIGNVNDASLGYNNTRFPVIFVSGCAFNSYYRDRSSLSKEWVFARNKGALAVIGQTTSGYEDALKKHTNNWYNIIFNSLSEPSLGESLKNTAFKVKETADFNYLDILANTQTVLFGDPLIKIFNLSKPDYLIDSSSVKIINTGTENQLSFKILNIGTKDNLPLKIKVTEYGAPTTQVKYINKEDVSYSDSATVTLPLSGLATRYKIELDYIQDVNEISEANNIYSMANPSIVNGTNAPKPKDDTFITNTLLSTKPTVNILKNDSLYNFIPASISNVIIDLDPSTPEINTNRTIMGEGVWELRGDSVSFTPIVGFAKDPNPIVYSIKDISTEAISYANVSIDYTPICTNNKDTTKVKGRKKINVIDNDYSGDTPLAGSIKLNGTDTPGDSLLVIGQGVWYVDRLEGAVSFVPNASFSKDPTPVGYTLRDDDGNLCNLASVELDKFPIAKNDFIGYKNSGVNTLKVFENDDLGDLVDSLSVAFVGNPNQGLNLGVWSISNGTIRYTPNNSSNPAPPSIFYTIKDNQGNLTQAEIKLDDFPPSSQDDLFSYSSGTVKTVQPLVNDVNGDVPIEIFLTDGDLGTGDKVKTIPSQGIWKVNQNNSVTFTPYSTFGGSPSSIYYYSIDEEGTESNLGQIQLSVILPVKVEYFKVKADLNGNKVSWGSKSEIEFSHYELQKSMDLKEFYTIETSMPNRNGNYEFMDSDTKSGIHYYRLRMVNLDESIEYYGKIISVKRYSSDNEILAYPNPINENKLYLKNIENLKTVELYSLDGRKINANIDILSSEKMLNFKNLNQTGTFLLILTYNKGVYPLKIQFGSE
ncbi:MAG: C25 family cysteine peptidase [Leadbetterella sp.]